MILITAFGIFLYTSIFYKIKIKQKTGMLPNNIIKVFFMISSLNFLFPISIKKIEANGVFINDELFAITKKSNTFLYVAFAVFAVFSLSTAILIFYFPNSFLAW